ncbi:MAG: hypothetical protein IKK09_03415 [Clostridia bacterium]|nr:hypothetical protein [Clostridia bacterium]
MMSMNNISVSFRAVNAQGDCFADIVLPLSGNKISDFKVRQGPGGGIMIHMPADMGTTWIFEEIEWADVRKQVTEEYRRLINNLPIFVKLHSFDEKNNCLADITLRETGVAISDFKVMVGPGGGVMVHMPSWMHTRWSYTEIQWSEVRQIITREYISAVSARKQSGEAITDSAPTKICTFYSSAVKTEADAAVTLNSSGEQLEGIHLVHTKDRGSIQVFVSEETNCFLNNTGMECAVLVEMVSNEYRRQMLQEDCEDISDSVTVKFHNIQEVTTCLVDINLPHKKNIIKGFRIREIKSEERIIISTPKWMERWNDNRVTWYDLCELITNEYNNCYHTEESKDEEIQDTPISSVVLTESNETVDECVSVEQTSKQPAKEKNEFGRIKNAENSSFIFYPIRELC